MTISRFLTLNTGFKMPSLGFGTYLLKGDALKDALDYALFVGYRHIDTAAVYSNEAEIGQVIEDRQRAGKLNRKDLFITTKVSKYCMERQPTLECVQQSLDSLRTTYVDMLLIHHPWACARSAASAVTFQHVDLLDTWSTLVCLFKQGQASSIGVSNFTLQQLQRILSGSSVAPANVQLECHAYYQQRKLKSFCDSQHIAVSAYAALGAPDRPSHHVQSTASLLTDPVIVALAQSYKKTPAQILLNFLLRQGFVVLPKSATKARIQENFASSDFTITNIDLESIFSLEKGKRFFNFPFMKGHPEYFPGEHF
jgi:aldehyde reductase